MIDFETTGLAEDRDSEPIEFGAVLLDPDRNVIATCESSIRPRASVPRVVQVLTGIADVDLQHAPPIDALAAGIAEALDGRILVAHNSDFERHFLSRFVSPEFAARRYLDTQDLLAVAHPDAPDLRLETLARRLLGRDERHRALSDALDLAAVLSATAVGARSGGARYVAVREALARYDPESAWLPLVASAQAAPSPEPARQYVVIGATHEKPVPFDAEAIAAALGDERRGRRHLPGYRVRAEQIEMAREFVRLLDTGGRLLLEGGTGVGKSLAYLSALIPFAMERAAGGLREPVLVSTRTKLLQDQLLSKDIPAAAALLGYPDLRALSIKGRANYVCARRCRQVLAEGMQRDIFAGDRLAYAALATSAQLRAHGEIGTLPGALLFRFPPLRDLRRRAVAARAEHCTREQCAGERTCPFGLRRAALASADLVVANHDLLLRWLPDYPRFTHVVIDEAHELAGVADEVYASELRPESVLESFDELFAAARRSGSAPAPAPPAGAPAEAWRRDLQQELAALGRGLAAHASEFGEVQLPPRAGALWPELAALAHTSALRLDAIAAAAQTAGEVEIGEDGAADLVARARADLADAAECLRSAFGEYDDERVASFEGLGAPFDRWRLALRQVSPAASFHESFLDRLESLACVSASLFVRGDPFASLGELEIESPPEVPSWRVRVASPFAYAEHMRVVGLSGDGEITERTAHVLATIAKALSGRTLGLFTSLRRMRAVHERLALALRGEGLDVLMPRRATDDPAALVARFQRTEGHGVLLGARTFWQGIDIPGSALQAVVIEKLPFEVPSELRRRREARIREQGGDAFFQYTLGKMLLNLKQMVGRLIRSEDDRGIVVIVDPRRDRPYFERLREALPEGCSVAMCGVDELLEQIAELSLGASTGAAPSNAADTPPQARGERRG